MKNRLLILPLLLLSTCLFSCGESSSLWAFKDDYKLPYFDRNGDLFLQDEAEANSYSTVGKSETVDYLANRINDASSCFVLLYSSRCSTCIKNESSFIDFALESKIEIFLGDVSNSISFVTSLKEAFPDYEEALSDPYTPEVFYLQSPKQAEIFDILSELGNPSNMKKALDASFNLTSIYHFTSFAAYQKALEKNKEESLVFFLDETNSDDLSFYDSNVRSLARHQDKNVYLVETNKLSEDDIAGFSGLYPSFGSSQTLVGLLSSDGSLSSSYDYQNQKEEAVSLASSYFI